MNDKELKNIIIDLNLNKKESKYYNNIRDIYPEIIQGIDNGFNISIKSDHVKKIIKALRKNEGYCPCRLQKKKENFCICQDFLNAKSGFCLCGFFNK